jgi:hypothetical protein
VQALQEPLWAVVERCGGERMQEEGTALATDADGAGRATVTPRAAPPPRARGVFHARCSSAAAEPPRQVLQQLTVEPLPFRCGRGGCTW